MDAAKFIEERNRMCKHFDNECNPCPAFNACKDELCCAVGLESTMDAKAQIAIVEDWASEHPRKTRQDIFLEQWPEAAIDNGILELCPRMVSAAHRNQYGDCETLCESCIDCRCEFWMQEVE